MSKEKTVIFEPETIHAPDSCRSSKREPISMYKHGIAKENITPNNQADTVNKSGIRPKPIMNMEKED